MIKKSFGAGQIIGDAIKHKKNADYDLIVIIRDELPCLTNEDKTSIKDNAILPITLGPSCLDCFLLQIIENSIPKAAKIAQCKKCKSKLEQLIDDPANSESYKHLLSKELLERKRKSNKELDKVLKIFELSYIKALLKE